ncbi:hypothetical protein M0804_003497 [Polistes exclamans]|nr:hypothetical protein M0804_003497 [Polistes exclamans]
MRYPSATAAAAIAAARLRLPGLSNIVSLSQPICFVDKPKPIQVISMLIKSGADSNHVTRPETRAWKNE